MLTHEQRMERAVRFNRERRASRKAGQIATRELIREDALTPEELQELVFLYPEYKIDFLYKVGKIFHFKGILYEVIQEHTSQEDWKPNELPALYKRTIPDDVIPEWIQPTGAHDAYNIGDKVIYNGIIWVSKIDANTTVPDGDEPHNRYWEPE